jgi:hypothetical protein
VDTFQELCDSPGVLAVTEVDEEIDEKKSKIMKIKAKFKIAVCCLRSTHEVKTESGIDAIICRQIKRDALRSIIDQLFNVGSSVQAVARHVPYTLIQKH